jgi:hypothetical protein
MQMYGSFYLIFALLVLIPVSALLVFRKYIPHHLKESQQAVLIGPLSYFFAIYAFFLGFSVITLWQNYNDAEASASQEANSLVDLFRLSRGVSGSDAFRDTVTAYVRSVIDVEWEAMRQIDVTANTGTTKLQDQIWDLALKLGPENIREQEIYRELLHELTQFNNHRRERILLISGKLLSPMWLILIIGSVCSLFGLYYLSLKHNMVQTAVDIILIGIIALNILLIYELNKPFQGNISVSPQAFQMVYEKMTAFPPVPTRVP